MPTMADAADPVLLHAAGSLRGALNEVAAAYEKSSGLKVTAKYGASGLLREEIGRGEKAEVFASANMEHPQALAKAGKSGPVVLFARNQLCALVRPGLAVAPANLVDRMLESGVKLGTSTPKADPSGDYAWEVFRKADAQRPGAYATRARRRRPTAISTVCWSRRDAPTSSSPIAPMRSSPCGRIPASAWWRCRSSLRSARTMGSP
jgi:ABC-type molybdate transport system substrate-binding protein